MTHPPRDKEDELALLIGKILRSAFLEDDDFRKALRGPNLLLEKIGFKSTNQLVQFGLQSSFNSHIVSSFHAARSIELLYYEIKNRFPKNSDFLFLVMHSFSLEVVLGLQCARQLFSQNPVVELLNERATEIGRIFGLKFPLLKETRDAMAHDDERVFGIVKRKTLGNTFEHQQMVSLQGTRLQCKNERLKDIEFNFPTSNYFDLVKDIEVILTE